LTAPAPRYGADFERRWPKDGRTGMTIECFPVEASHILMFARAIGDENPVYTDPSSPEAQQFGGMIAPPTFTMASLQFDPDMPLRPKPGEPWFGSASEPSGAQLESSGVLHAEQHFKYHRPILAGCVLTTDEHAGASWERTSRRGGILRFEELLVDYVGVDDGQIYVSARFVSVLPSATP
jgi:acyl dehydratase